MALSKAKSHLKKGQILEAKKFCLDILNIYPNNFRLKQFINSLETLKFSKNIYNDLVNFFNNKKFYEVVKLSEEHLKISEKNHSIWNIYAAANEELGKLDDALIGYQRAITLNPNDPEYYNNMGILLEKREEFDDAIISYNKALSIKPDYVEANYNLGNAFKKLGEIEAATFYFKKAISYNANYTQAYNNLGNILHQEGRIDEAIRMFQKAISINPSLAETYCNLGYAFIEKNNINKAILALKKSIHLNPNFFQSYLNLGNIFSDEDQIINAIDMYNKALSIKPDFELVRSKRLHQLANICNWKAIEEDRLFISQLGTQKQFTTPWSLLSLEDNPQNHRKRSEIFAKIKFPQKSIPFIAPISKFNKRIRVGYFSSDFYDHATMSLISKVFSLHNREKFEIYIYSYDLDKKDEIKTNLIKSVDVFDDVSLMSDKDIALLARQDQIDIAVDLKGYTRNNRSGILAYRAAPIQVNYLGYPGTMGTDFIDYLIADSTIIPKEYRDYYSEKIIYMPHSYQPTNNSRLISPKVVTKSDMGLPEDSFIFCCFNNSYKITSIEFDIWMRLLKKVDGSVLWLLQTNEWAEINLKKEAEKREVNPDRIIFAKKIAQSEHLARQKLADLFLDTFNVNAHTTASDALWGGLPVLTMIGKGFPARVAASLLNALGLPELITDNEKDYEYLALELASNPEKLTKIKNKLIMNRMSKPLFNTEIYTKHLENGYQQVYQNYIEGNKPKTININHLIY
jgi:predicted O-linked N-acetylglucosamine transferase (SPINDLY family)